MNDVSVTSRFGAGHAVGRTGLTFILSALTGETDIRAALGAAEYSYRFVLEGYRAALGSLGPVVVVKDVAGVEACHSRVVAEGRQAVFLCFAPPHRAPLGLACPTVCVVAWEFSTIPAEPLDADPRSDWRHVFARTGRAIALSRHAARTIQDAMGPDFCVAAISAPVALRLSAIPPRVPGAAREVSLRGTVFDSRVYGPHFGRPPLAPAAPPAALDVPPRRFGWFRHPAALPAPPPAPPPQEPATNIALGGVVYASVFNPMDGRKNWQDLLTAFCYAFRDQSGATLVMKMVHSHRDAFEILLDILTRALQPFQCRVVALHGWMEDAEYDALIDSADFYVNCSTGEGQCLPLMEFMAAGRPGIAPDHTAMADYVDGGNSFVLRYTDEYNVWPQDPRDLYRTMRHRLDWESLMQAFQASFAVATAEPGRYAAMGQAARESVASTCGETVVADRLRRFLAPA